MAVSRTEDKRIGKKIGPVKGWVSELELSEQNILSSFIEGNSK